MGHCRGFGIHSPSDYRFVRNVINEQWPYYAYDEIGKDDKWLRRKLGQLYFRIANERQPKTIIDWVGVGDYLSAGCRHADIVESADSFDMAIVPIQTEYNQLLEICGPQSVVVFENIWQQPALWHCIEYDRRSVITFDLYYCGIVFFDKSRSPQNYIINF
jgi:hypothetical protein